MKQSYLVAMIFCVHLSGCVDLNEDEQLADQAQAETTQTRPSLASICSSACNNSHGMHKCVDAGSFAGPANVSVFPLIEGKTVVPSTTLGNNGSWANTSCPNCQWHLIAVTSDQNGEVVTTGITQATNDVNVQRAARRDWEGHVALQIVDPTDASVGVCNLSVPIELFWH